MKKRAVLLLVALFVLASLVTSLFVVSIYAETTYLSASDKFKTTYNPNGNTTAKNTRPKVDMSKIEIPTDRPRVYINSTQLAELKAKMASSEYKAFYDEVIEGIKKDANKEKNESGLPLNGMLLKPGDSLPKGGTAPKYSTANNYTNTSMNVNSDHREVMLANAFLYLIDNSKYAANGQKAVTMLHNMLQTMHWEEINPITGDFSYNIAKGTGMLMYYGSIVYDWCYDVFKNDSEEKRFIERGLHKIVTELMEWRRAGTNNPAGRVYSIGAYPLTEWTTALNGHINGDDNLINKVIMGIALYNEELDLEPYPSPFPTTAPLVPPYFDTLLISSNYKKPDYFEDVTRLVLNYTIPGYNEMFEAEMVFEGNSYGEGRAETMMIVEKVFAPLTFKNVDFDELVNPKIGKVSDRFIYTRRPDGIHLSEGDDFSALYFYANVRRPIFNMGNMLAYSSYGNMIALRENITQGQKTGNTKYNGYEGNLVFYALWADPDISAADAPQWSEIPLSRYFPSPYGSIVARTSWDEGQSSKAFIATMNIVERQSTNHQHQDAGSFQLYYKGILAVDSGFYDEYFTAHRQNYTRETIAHNAVLIKDTQATGFDGNRGDGNQFYTNTPPVTVEQWKETVPYVAGTADESRFFSYGKVWSHDIPEGVKPEYSFIKGSIKNAYGAKRVDEYTRSMVFLNFENDKYPGAFIVYDNIDTVRATAEKKFLLHTLQDPVISGNRYTNVTTHTVPAGGYTYNGKLVTDTLLPKSADLNVEVIGRNNNSFYANGQNWPPFQKGEPSDKKAYWMNEGGKYRIEVSSKVQSDKTQFLNVMQVMDATGVNAVNPQDVTLVESADFVGAMIYDRIVLFSKGFTDINNQGTFEINGEAGKEYKILITDIANGNWMVVKQGDSNFHEGGVVTEDANTFYFTGTNGTYTLSLEEVNPIGFYMYSGVFSGDTQTTVSVRLENRESPIPISGDVYLAIYDSSNKLIGLKADSFTGLSMGDADIVRFTFNNIENAASYKVIAVKDVTSMAPLARSILKSAGK